jgi:hypothetical protein
MIHIFDLITGLNAEIIVTKPRSFFWPADMRHALSAVGCLASFSQQVPCANFLGESFRLDSEAHVVVRHAELSPAGRDPEVRGSQEAPTAKLKLSR